jgi:hypothetical protein
MDSLFCHGMQANHGRGMSCDNDVICTLAQSYFATPGTEAELAASQESDKYSILPNSYLFQSITLDNLGTVSYFILHQSNYYISSNLGQLVHNLSSNLVAPQTSLGSKSLKYLSCFKELCLLIFIR